MQLVTHVANTSSQRQSRWTTVSMPLALANELPSECLVDGQYPAIKADRLGEVAQLWHLKAAVDGHSELVLTEWDELPDGQTLPDFELSPWVFDAPEKAILKIVIWENGIWRAYMRLAAGGLVSESKGRQVWRFDGHHQGYSATLFATLNSGSDVVDLDGMVIWSDPSRPEMRLPDVQISVECGNYPEPSGEEIELYRATRNDHRRWRSDAWRVYRGGLPHGTAVPFRGVLLARQDSAPLSRVPITLEEQAEAPLGLTRAMALAAAREGPLVAVCEWGQRFLAWDSIPHTSQRSDAQAFRDYLAAPGGTLFEKKPLGQELLHGSTGAQWGFGCLKGTQALSGDPWFLYEMVHSADDYLLRGCHHRDEQGRRIERSVQGELFETWSGSIEFRAGPQWGVKARRQPYGWDKAGPRCVQMDDQHRAGNLLISTFCLTGDWLLRECLLDMLAVDELRAFPSRGRYDAPRASGRLLQDWAKNILMFDGALRDRWVALAERELLDCQTAQITGSDMTFQQFKVDNRVLPNTEAIMPWQHGLLCLGLFEMSKALGRIGHLSAPTFRAMAQLYADQMMIWATVRDTSDSNSLYPIHALKWNQGAANQPPYYTYPRDGAKPHDGSPGYDMWVGPQYWFDWWSAAIVLGCESQDAVAQAIAEEINNRWNGHESTNISRAEWWAFE